MAVITRRNLRRTARLWSWGAMLAAPFFLLMGVLLVTGTGPGAQRPVEMWQTGSAGAPVELLPAGGKAAIWGRPAADGVACTTHRSSGALVAELRVGPVEGRPAVAEDVRGTGQWGLLAVTEGTDAAATVVCRGGDLAEVAVSVDPAVADASTLRRALLLAAPVLFVLGWALRKTLGRQRADQG